MCFMGFFSSLFSSARQYSNQERQLSADRIRVLVSRIKVRTLDTSEERLVEEEIIKRRRGDGKISLHQIDEVLQTLQNKNKISEFDRKGLMKVFVEYYKKNS